MKSWKLHLLATACGLAFVGSASAADLPLKAAPMYVPTSNWSGPYVGVHIGVGTHTGLCQIAGASDYGCVAGDTADDGRTKGTGLLAGVHGGYDWQDRNFVYGIAADWTWTNIKSKGYGGSGSMNYQSKVDWLASFRGRMGLAVDNTMVYVTGGVALGKFVDSTNQGASFAQTRSNTAIGWVAGVGVEHKINRNWSIAAEYLHYDFAAIEEGSYLVGGSTYNHRFDHVIDVGRVALNYRF